MPTSADIPTDRTLAWLRSELGGRPCRILEVGCGRGEVAAGLIGQGHDVLAIDVDPECIERARERGVPAEVGQFPRVPDSPDQRFDAVLFGRVLHHIESLSAACRRCDWFWGLLRVGRDLGIVPADEWNWDAVPLDGWREPSREHGLHTGAAMLEALAERFDPEPSTGAPYAYRWFARYLEGDPRGHAVTRAIYDTEVALIEAESIVPIGLRAAARKR